MLTGWIIGLAVGAVVALVVVVLLVLMIVGASRAASKAEAIVEALEETTANTDSLWQVEQTNLATARIVGAAAAARRHLAGRPLAGQASHTGDATGAGNGGRP